MHVNNRKKTSLTTLKGVQTEPSSRDYTARDREGRTGWRSHTSERLSDFHTLFSETLRNAREPRETSTQTMFKKKRSRSLGRRQMHFSEEACRLGGNDKRPFPLNWRGDILQNFNTTILSLEGNYSSAATRNRSCARPGLLAQRSKRGLRRGDYQRGFQVV